MKRYAAFEPPEYVAWERDDEVVAAYRATIERDPARAAVVERLDREALLALSKIDPATGKKVPFAFNGQEMHGVPNNAKGEPNGIGQDFSHGCVGLKNADIKEISAAAKSGEIVRFDP